MAVELTAEERAAIRMALVFFIEAVPLMEHWVPMATRGCGAIPIMSALLKKLPDEGGAT